MLNRITEQKRQELISRFSAIARQRHFAGDVVEQRQAEEEIRLLAPRAVAEKIIRELYVAK